MATGTLWQLILVTALADTVLGCGNGATPTLSQIRLGMNRDELVRRFGEPVTVGAGNDSTWAIEQDAYPGPDGTIVLWLANGRVSKVESEPNVERELSKKLRLGMTREDVVAAIGKPQSGEELGKQDFTWVFGGGQTSFETLNAFFEDGKVSGLKLIRNQ